MSAAVMPMRRVPWERAGAAEAVRIPRPATTTRRCLNIYFSRFAGEPCKVQAKPDQRERLQKARHVACMAPCNREERHVAVQDTADAGGIPRSAAQTGLTLTPEDIEHLHKGYVGLLSLMERIPSDWAWAAEPPHVFRADE